MPHSRVSEFTPNTLSSHGDVHGLAGHAFASNFQISPCHSLSACSSSTLITISGISLINSIIAAESLSHSIPLHPIHEARHKQLAGGIPTFPFSHFLSPLVWDLTFYVIQFRNSIPAEREKKRSTLRYIMICFFPFLPTSLCLPLLLPFLPFVKGKLIVRSIDTHSIPTMFSLHACTCVSVHRVHAHVRGDK